MLTSAQMILPTHCLVFSLCESLDGQQSTEMDAFMCALCKDYRAEDLEKFLSESFKHKNLAAD